MLKSARLSEDQEDLVKHNIAKFSYDAVKNELSKKFGSISGSSISLRNGNLDSNVQCLGTAVKFETEKIVRDCDIPHGLKVPQKDENVTDCRNKSNISSNCNCKDYVFDDFTLKKEDVHMHRIRLHESNLITEDDMKESVNSSLPPNIATRTHIVGTIYRKNNQLVFTLITPDKPCKPLLITVVQQAAYKTTLTACWIYLMISGNKISLCIIISCFFLNR